MSPNLSMSTVLWILAVNVLHKPCAWSCVVGWGANVQNGLKTTNPQGDKPYETIHPDWLGCGVVG